MLRFLLLYGERIQTRTGNLGGPSDQEATPPRLLLTAVTVGEAEEPTHLQPALLHCGVSGSIDCCGKLCACFVCLSVGVRSMGEVSHLTSTQYLKIGEFKISKFQYKYYLLGRTQQALVQPAGYNRRYARNMIILCTTAGRSVLLLDEVYYCCCVRQTNT